MRTKRLERGAGVHRKVGGWVGQARTFKGVEKVVDVSPGGEKGEVAESYLALLGGPLDELEDVHEGNEGRVVGFEGLAEEGGEVEAEAEGVVRVAVEGVGGRRRRRRRRVGGAWRGLVLLLLLLLLSGLQLLLCLVSALRSVGLLLLLLLLLVVVLLLHLLLLGELWVVLEGVVHGSRAFLGWGAEEAVVWLGWPVPVGGWMDERETRARVRGESRGWLVCGAPRWDEGLVGAWVWVGVGVGVLGA